MKMAKATQADIDAAGDAMSVLNDISSGYYPARNGEEDAPTFFDPDDFDHLRKFYDLMSATLDKSHGWPGRVIGGMCYVILYDKNQIVDPDADTLEHHPRTAACIDACDGIDTSDLKSGSVSIIQKLHDEAAKRVLAQRDELLAQLEKIATADHEAQFAALDMKGIARAAISKAKGNAKSATFQDRVAACLAFCDGIKTSDMAGKSIAEYVVEQAFITGMAPSESGMEIGLKGIGAQLLAASFAGQFAGTGATNYVEIRMSHPAIGPFSVTIQRTEGTTPVQKLKSAEAQRDEQLGMLKVFREQCELIASSNWRKWEELASPEEFERWVKSRANHMAAQAISAIAKAEGGL